MTDRLNKAQLDYVWFHIEQHIDLSELKSWIVYSDDTSANKIVFRASDQPIDKTRFIPHAEDKLPVLYPLSSEECFYHIDKDHLVFQHDILKAIFYLLSGYQEFNSPHQDFMGRYPHQRSIQHELKITDKPIVNYYISIIAEALTNFAHKHNKVLKTRRLFDSFGFMLTHDVDRIDFYHWRETVLKLLQLLGLKKSSINKRTQLKVLLNAITPTLFPGFKKNPWWNFEELRQLERSLGINSVWYFLNRDKSPHDAKYHLEEERIKKLIQTLQNDGCEIGLHGSIKTATATKAMQKAFQRLRSVSNEEVVGTRQHCLKVHYPDTLKILEAAGLKYDTSLGFAEHEGYRNSYCYPFKPFDHQAQKMMNIWEFPLTVMDATFLGYRSLNYDDMFQSFNKLITESKKFGGLLVMLWHNCNFDEIQNPGILDYYKNQLKSISSQKPVSMTGKELLKRLDN